MENQNVNGAPPLKVVQGEEAADAFTKLQKALHAGVSQQKAIEALTDDECQEVVLDWLRGVVVVLHGTSRKSLTNKKERALATNLLDAVSVIQRIFQRIWPLTDAMLEKIRAEAEASAKEG